MKEKPMTEKGEEHGPPPKEGLMHAHWALEPQITLPMAWEFLHVGLNEEDSVGHEQAMPASAYQVRSKWPTR